MDTYYNKGEIDVKLYINFDNKTKKVKIDVITDEFGKEINLCDAMPYIMDELYELVVKEQKKNMWRQVNKIVWLADIFNSNNRSGRDSITRNI